MPPSLRTNYALREQVLAVRDAQKGGPTAVLTHGANPGLVSHFVKQALLNVAADTSVDAGNPKTREEWAALAAKLGVKVIHIAERDTQVANTPKKLNEFVNTWSVDGFVSEGCQPAELGWGTHEKELPPQGRASRVRPPERDLSDAAGRKHARAHVDAEGWAFPWLSDHARRVDLDLRLSDASRRRQGRVPPDGALRLSPMRRRGDVGARIRRP